MNDDSINANSSPRLPISAAIITLNEEENLPRCLETLAGLVSEIVVVDSGSTDRTREIAGRFGARFEAQPWAGHIAQKNFALSRCSQAWVLCLDADEAVSPELAASIRRLFAAGEPESAGFAFNRLNFYLGRWIRHAWNPEWRCRLVRRSCAKWGGLNPHDKLEVAGRIDRLPGNLLHFPFGSFFDHLETELRYSRIMANSYASSGRRFHWYHLIFSPWIAWFRVMVFKSAWRDGWRGWLIAGSKWMGTFAKYALFLELSGLRDQQEKPS